MGKLYNYVVYIRSLANRIIWFGLAEIGLCTSTRWSPGTWQLLLMFHLDRVNRLPEQTQRRVYGCAAPAQRRGGSGAKIFHWGVSPSKKVEHSYIPRLSLHVRSFESTGNYPSGVPPPSYEYYIHRAAPTHIREQSAP